LISFATSKSGQREIDDNAEKGGEREKENKPNFFRFFGKQNKTQKPFLRYATATHVTAEGENIMNRRLMKPQSTTTES
jgi:hypothetical protein